MRLAVLAAPDSWYLRDLMRAAGSRHQIVQLPFSQMVGQVCNLPRTAGQSEDGSHVRIVSAGHKLADFDAILIRTMPPGSLEQVVFRMDCLGRCEAAGGIVINPARAVEAAVDKFLASAKLAEAGLVTPRTICCQSPDEAMAAFADLGGDVVLKPLFGSEGRGITRLNDEALALRAFKMLAQLGAVLYIQEFIEHEGADLRLLVIGERVLGMRRTNPLDWRTNISRGARGEAFTPDHTLIDIARRAAKAVGAPLAGVDLLPSRDGRLYCLEVNAVPGWKAIGRAHELDVAGVVLEFVERRVRGRDIS